MWITLIIRESIVLLKSSPQLSSFCVWDVRAVMVRSVSPSPAPCCGPWSLTSVFVVSRTSSWKISARIGRGYLKSEVLEKAFCSLLVHERRQVSNLSFPCSYALKSLALSMWIVQVMHAVCRLLNLLKQAMGFAFLDPQDTQYNHHTIFGFLYCVDVT